MKKTFYIFILISFSRQVLGQTNLIPNSSFESYTYCPNGAGDIPALLNWEIYGGSPDPYNTCSTNSQSAIPANWLGNQTPFDGNGYVGIGTYCKPCSPTREYLGVQLTQTLSIGTKYFVSCYISKSDSNEVYWINCPTNRFGFRFSKTAFSYTAPVPTDNYSQVNSTVTITNSTGWTKISGSFIADSNYKFVSLGNFFDNLNMDTTACNYPYAFGYYYVDKICVSTDSMLCNVISGINEYSEKSVSTLYPNPTTGQVFIKLSHSKNITLKVTDKYGQLILTKTNFKENEIDLSGFSDGLYFIEILSDGKTSIDKIMIRH